MPYFCDPELAPYALPYGIMTPREGEAVNLLVPVAVSASHVAFSSIRMEPQWMVLGHAAGVLVALALALPSPGATTEAAAAVQDVPATQLHEALRGQGAMLDLPAISAQSSSCVLNRCVAHDSGANAKCQFSCASANADVPMPVLNAQCQC